MTLKERFKQWLDTDPREQIREVPLEIITDDYAIGFAEWVIHNYPNKGTNHEDKLLYSKKPSPLGWSIEELLKTYKKEKGL